MTKTPFVGSKFFGLDLSQLIDQLWGLRRQISKRVLLLEFSTSALTFAQASLRQGEIQFTNLRRVVLPESAVERGVPTDPATMAALLKDLCRENQIYAHRAAVVLPPEATFSKLIDIPEQFSPEEARQYLREPSSGVQIPIPLHQTDFDLIPTSLPLHHTQETSLRKYFLATVPQKIVEQLLVTLQLADLELQFIELGLISQLRLIAPEAFDLATNHFLIVLELLPECTHLMIVSSSGPVMFDRLAAIREFTEPNLDQSKTEAAMAEALSAESITLSDERYLPISDLDLRVLVHELKQAMDRFVLDFNHCCWKSVVITGINSAHPMLPELLSTSLGLPVNVVRPIAADGVGHVSMSQLLVHQGLGRILGLGLRLMPHFGFSPYPSPDSDNTSRFLPSFEPQSSSFPDASVLQLTRKDLSFPTVAVPPVILDVDAAIQSEADCLLIASDSSELLPAEPSAQGIGLNRHSQAENSSYLKPITTKSDVGPDIELAATANDETISRESMRFENTSLDLDKLTIESPRVVSDLLLDSTEDLLADEHEIDRSPPLTAYSDEAAPPIETNLSSSESVASILGELRFSDDSKEGPGSDI